MIVKNLGIPYKGSKRSIAYDIVREIYTRHPQAEYFYDLFGGGGAITAVAVQFGYKVIYNEYNTAVYNLFKRMCEKEPLPKEWYEWVSREKFKAHLGKTDAYSAMVQSVWSFGNNSKDYLFGKPIEETKRLMHEVVVNKDYQALEKLKDMLGTELVMPTAENIQERRLQYVAQIKHCRKFKDMQRLQQLERLQQLHNLSYEQVPIITPKDKTVVYVDPPYRNVSGYVVGAFDNAKLDDWFKQLEYPCYMSEYSAPHECVYSIQKRVTFSAINNKDVKIEKLYWNGVK